MKRLLSFICLLGFGASPILSFLTAVRPATAQTQPRNISAYCQDHQQVYAFTQWTQLVGQLDDESSSRSSEPFDITPMLNLLKMPGQNPQTIQIAIDRLTLVRDLQEQPLLLSLIEQTPTRERSQFLPVVDQLVTLALALPPGYNYAQSRALITAAIAYNELNQKSRSTPLLQQASQTLVGIAVPGLKAETQWRLAQAWFGMGQKSAGQASLAAATVTLKTLSPQSPPLDKNLPAQLVNSYLLLGQWSEAIAAARSIAILTQQSEQLFRIASAYQKSRQVQPAVALFNQTIDSLLKTSGVVEKDLAEIATEGIISFAQAGGVTTATLAAKQLPSNQPALRARAWLAIAGEARQQKRPKEAVPALEQLIAAGKIGHKQGFGSGFGRMHDYEWSGSLYALSRSQGYVPEMLQFIEQLNLKTEAAEFLITEAVKAKRFDEAYQLIPQPMLLVIDAGVIEVQDDWRWWVANVAAHEGEPEQLLALSEELLPQIGSSDPKQLSAGYIRTSHKIDPSSSDRPRPPMFLADIPPSTPLPEDQAISAIRLLQKQGQTEMVGRLAEALADQAEKLLNRQPTVKLNWDRHPLEWIYNLEHFLRQQQQTSIGDRLYALQVDYLKQTEDLEQRADLIPFTSSLDDPQGAITDFIELAETFGVADQIQVAKRVFEQAVLSGQKDIMAQWQSRAQFSPREQAELMLDSAGMIRYRYGLDEEILWYDQILQLMQGQPLKGGFSNRNKLNTMIERYLFIGEIDKAQQAISLIDDYSEVQRQQNRLDCLLTTKNTQ